MWLLEPSEGALEMIKLDCGSWTGFAAIEGCVAAPPVAASAVETTTPPLAAATSLSDFVS